MKLLAALALLSLVPCVAQSAPVPKHLMPKTDPQEKAKLRTHYDQLQRDLGDTAEGQKLRTELARAERYASVVVGAEQMLSRPTLTPREAEPLQTMRQRSLQLARSPREEELFQLSVWEKRQSVKPAPLFPLPQ